jgi:hypothetical protein
VCQKKSAEPACRFRKHSGIAARAAANIKHPSRVCNRLKGNSHKNLRNSAVTCLRCRYGRQVCDNFFCKSARNSSKPCEKFFNGKFFRGKQKLQYPPEIFNFLQKTLL